jgi:hypothetical protein
VLGARSTCLSDTRHHAQCAYHQVLLRIDFDVLQPMGPEFVQYVCEKLFLFVVGQTVRKDFSHLLRCKSLNEVQSTR